MQPMVFAIIGGHRSKLHKPVGAGHLVNCICHASLYAAGALWKARFVAASDGGRFPADRGRKRDKALATLMR